MLLAGADKNIHDDLQNIFKDTYKIISADNEYECFNALSNNKIEIVFVTLNLQIMDGLDFLKTLAQDSRYKNLPIIAIVTFGDFDSVSRAIESGASDIVTTPLNEMMVTYRTRNVIAHCQQAEKDKQILEMNRYLEIDALTGLYNRETFYDKAANIIHDNPEVQYCIVYLDISCFKVVNDLFHTETGNLILKTAADYFQKKINPQIGLSGRIEADHFVLCVPQDTLDMDRLIRELDDTIKSLGISHNILFFAGVYPVADMTIPVDQMCDRASMALNKIKGNYARRYNFYDVGMRDRMLKEQMIVRDMEFALKDNQFTIFLQPIYRPETNEIVSAEALVRWFHPESGMISPGYFIPVFERNGFIVKLDRFVWETVCKFLRSRLDAGKKIVPVSVNVSRLNFYSYDLLIFLLNLLKKYDLEPWMLKLEVTESAYTDNPQQLIKIINQFKENGFPILMDDFGSGYSSLNMLKNIDIDVLKVDMAFVREIEHSERARIILLMIIGLARELGMGVVTEGVETQTQLDYITNMGSVDIQGYYFSKPLAVKDFNALFDKYNP
ncbi:MAG: EAL domain-containing protein [Selenomonadaceae bacterium]|nr:EAL domain-containing protein [Selenomonadaceae bacterium]